MRRVALSLLILAVGCAEGLPSGPPPAPLPPPPAGPEPELPPLADISFPDWADVEGGSEVPLPLPADRGPLRWAFAPPGRRLAYDLAQTLNQLVVAVHKETKTETRSRDRNQGWFEFVADRDRTAKVFIRIETQEAVRNGVSAPKAEIDKATAATFEARVREDGEAEVKKLSGQADAQFFFDALLSLHEGEKPIKDGTVRTRAAGAFKVGRYECVRLETEFELSPRTPSGRSLLRGRTVGYFAWREGHFVRTSTAVTMTSRMKALNPNIGWIVNALDSKTSFRLKLLEK